MTASAALLGYGTKFQVETANSPNTFFDMGEVYNISPPSSEIDQVEVSHMLSPGRTREFIDGLIDPGECSFQMNYIPGSASDLFLSAIRDTAIGTSRTRRCRLVYPNNKIDQFSANLQDIRARHPDRRQDDRNGFVARHRDDHPRQR
jgi:hypothetical protein